MILLIILFEPCHICLELLLLTIQPLHLVRDLIEEIVDLFFVIAANAVFKILILYIQRCKHALHSLSCIK